MPSFSAPAAICLRSSTGSSPRGSSSARTTTSQYFAAICPCNGRFVTSRSPPLPNTEKIFPEQRFRNGGKIVSKLDGGSDEHMANTVIGDKVNSASRLEGLTRVYHLPVIVSDYIKKEAESISKRYKFYEIDTVQVKGKTEGKKIYYPIDTFVQGSAALSEKFEIYEGGLKAYYKGDWSKARKMFKQADMEVCEVFLERMGRKSAPAKWSGIWTMTTK